MSFLFCFGLGYTGQILGRSLLGQGWRVAGTSRAEEACARARARGFECVLFDGEAASGEVGGLVRQASHVLVSIPPDDDGDPVLARHGGDIAQAPANQWVGYLSTVGVYGDHRGAWVDETSQVRPLGPRGKRRLAAERAWLAFGLEHDKAVHVFRLPGIYGPGRNALAGLKAGRARRIVKEGQVFNRVHVGDIAAALRLSMASPRGGATYNVTDDEPAPPQDVITHAALLLGLEPPPEIPFEQADLSPMGKSFYGESKRVSNALIKSELGFTPRYPSYREGLKALLDCDGG